MPARWHGAACSWTLALLIAYGGEPADLHRPSAMAMGGDMSRGGVLTDSGDSAPKRPVATKRPAPKELGGETSDGGVATKRGADTARRGATADHVNATADHVSATADHVNATPSDGAQPSILLILCADALAGIILFFVFGALYSRLVLVKYPKRFPLRPSPAVVMLQGDNVVCAIFKVSCANFWLSFACMGVRAAHTLHITGVLHYWKGLASMIFAPCCTLLYVNSCTDLKEKLAGRKQDCCMAAVGACCFPCCVVAQDAQSLDLMTGATTGICSVTLPDDEAAS